MKKLTLLIVVVFGLLIFSCTKDEPLIRLDYIKAGVTEDGVNIVDISPDDTLFEDTYKSSQSNVERSIDINYDGVLDFKFVSVYHDSPSHTYAKNTIVPLNNNAVVSINSTDDIVDTLVYNSRIDINSVWNTNECLLSYISALDSQEILRDGLWHNVSNRYIGLMINNDEGIVYAWASVEFYGGEITVIRSYGYTNGIEK